MQNSEDSKKILTEVIRRQVAILGPDITIAKVKNVPGIQVNEKGEVLSIEGDPQVLLTALINQFVELSGLIVKKTMESILLSQPSGAALFGQISQAGSVSPINSPMPDAQANIEPEVQKQAPPVVPGASPAIHSDTESNITSANKDIEDLNKMLNNINSS